MIQHLEQEELSVIYIGLWATPHILSWQYATCWIITSITSWTSISKITATHSLTSTCKLTKRKQSSILTDPLWLQVFNFGVGHPTLHHIPTDVLAEHEKKANLERNKSFIVVASPSFVAPILDRDACETVYAS